MILAFIHEVHKYFFIWRENDEFRYIFLLIFLPSCVKVTRKPESKDTSSKTLDSSDFSYKASETTYCDSQPVNQTNQMIPQYKVERVPDQYIVHFHGFYSAHLRSQYITKALSRLPTRPDCIVQPRTNPMSVYPSDFDLVSCELSSAGRGALTDHPAVKSVTAQRRVTRFLKQLNQVGWGFIYININIHWPLEFGQNR